VRGTAVCAIARRYRRVEGLLLGTAGLGGLVIAWEAAARSGAINPVVLASPGRVATALLRQWRTGELPADLAVSAAEFALAFTLAVIVGGTLGLAMGLARPAEHALSPFVWFFYSAPLVAFQPLLLVWLGFGFWTVVVLAASLAAFPITVNTLAGVRATDPGLLRAVRAFGGRRLDVIVKVILPAALPLALAGLRLGAGRALVGIVVGEMFSANAGLGFRLTFYGARLRTADTLAPLLGIVAIGLLATEAVRFAERRRLATIGLPDPFSRDVAAPST
jgi:ABC-type nitrate/sulfonate/bicarbonate transport system permease component